MFTRRQALTGLAGAAAMAGIPASAETDLHAPFDMVLRGDDDDVHAGLGIIGRHGGLEVVAGLIFALRFRPHHERPILELLSEITGAYGPDDWHQWMLWQEARPEIAPHPSYLDIKRDLFLRIDPRFDDFLRPEYLGRDSAKIRFEEITWGGVKKDGIPSLDQPRMIRGSDADYLVGSDFVFGIAINGDVRAYPLRIMGWHEMFNDVVGGVPLALAYCTLCGSGILFETAVEGRDAPFVFGSSGFLYRSNKLMFDRETHSLWNQFTGKPVVGPLVGRGIQLKQRPVVIEPWVRWFARNPDTKVLSLETGHDRNYGSGVVYDKYFRSPGLMFPTITDETRLKQKDYVFGIRTFGGAKAWPVTAFEGGRVINDAVGNMNVVLIGDRLGRTVRAYDRGGMSFQPGASPDQVLSKGAVWTVTEEALQGPGGVRAPRIAGHIAYWFAWDGYLGAKSEFYQD